MLGKEQGQRAQEDRFNRRSAAFSSVALAGKGPEQSLGFGGVSGTERDFFAVEEPGPELELAALSEQVRRTNDLSAKGRPVRRRERW